MEKEQEHSPLDQTTTPPSTSKPSKPSPPRPRPTSYLSTTDHTIRHLHRLLSRTAGADTVLLTTHYTLLTLLSSLSLWTRRQARQTALALARTTAPLLLPGETVIAAISLPATSTRTAARLRALTDLISDVRAFMRLWGLLGILAWAGRAWRHPDADRVVRAIVYAQVLANVLFQALENGAYLAGHGVLGWSGERRRTVAKWSARFWAVSVGLELGRLWRVRRVGVAGGEDGKGGGEKQRDMGKMERDWWRQVVVNVAYLPLTVHWSLPEGAGAGAGLMSEFWVGVLGCVPGWIGVRQLWKETAEMEDDGDDAQPA
ncbi:MAG: hypothetical protein M1816_000989 [Peltula sp. TS41687]|nr:MAG: hypothetical protein M1816_000989 [Peltula sp. TS41687]